jgi:myo-inositol-1(or 4)-monophosphatase
MTPGAASAEDRPLPPDPRELLELALDAALAAGRLLVEGRPPDLRVSATKTSPTDIVTEMDTAAERLIVDRLLAARPQDGVLGEEGASGEGTSGVRWVIDPIDGTVNYLYDLPAWAVSIAAEVDGAAVAGVVHVPPLGETWTATRGGGAYRTEDIIGDHATRDHATGDGVPVRCADEVRVDRALVATGFGYDAGRRGSQAEVLRGVLPNVRDVRRMGSAAIDLCHVAGGRVDAYYERGVQRWDVAAAALIATEAGAVVGGLHGRPAGPEFTLAAPAGLFGPLHDLLAGLDPERG